MAKDLTEKRWLRIPPRNFTADGTANGKVPVSNACEFKVKQEVWLKANTVAPLQLEVKRIISETELFVGRKGNITNREDVSAFTTALSATVEALEQNRTSIELKEHERAVFEEEPVVAKRVILVDKCGDKIDDSNPLPVDATVTVGSIETRRLTHEDNDPDAGDVHDSIRVGDGDELLEITDINEARVADTLHIGGTNTVINVTNVPVEIKVGASAKTDRKLIIAVPKSKGVFWGFKANVDTTNGVNGGIALGKNQPLMLSVEITTPVYLVGPAGGVNVSIAEA